MYRDYQAEFINRIINDDSIFPFVSEGHIGEIDLTGLVNNDKNILLVDGRYGGILFHNTSPGIYEAHPQFLEEGRGRYALIFSRKSIDYMFRETPCIEIHAYSPSDLRNANIFATASGFKFINEFECEVMKNKKVFRHYVMDFERYINGSR